MDFETEKARTYAIVTNYFGYTSVVLATGLKLALRSYLQTARLITDCLPDDVDFIFAGQDEDETLPLLSILIPDQGLNIVSLQTVSSVDSKVVESGSLVEADLGVINGIDDCHSFSGLAMNLKHLNDNKSKNELLERKVKTARSWPAHHLYTDYIEALIMLAEESLNSGGHYKGKLDKKALQKSIDDIHLQQSLIATLR